MAAKRENKKEIKNRANLLNKINAEVLNLKKSPLYKYRTENNYLPVIGEGNHFSEIMFVGEAPGRNEAKTGKPFFGAAGKILDELLSSAEIRREDVYITNIVKDRPQENRDPTKEEIGIYGPFLDRQIEIIKPRIIATLGRYSMTYIINKFKLDDSLAVISKLHGKVLKINTKYDEVIFVPLYHPAAAIYNRETKGAQIKDMKILGKVLRNEYKV